MVGVVWSRIIDRLKEAAWPIGAEIPRIEGYQSDLIILVHFHFPFMAYVVLSTANTAEVLNEYVSGRKVEIRHEYFIVRITAHRYPWLVN